MTCFSDLGLIEPLCRALESEGYSQPTPIQAQAIPHVLSGRDVLAIAQTGTGKTAAFALPVLQFLQEVRGRRVPKSARALVLAPTRELAVQINDAFASYGKLLPLKRATIFGGVGQNPQVQALMRGVDVLVATPGRLIDLMQQGHVSLSGVEFFVLDEADRMLDMGFIHDVRRIVAQLPAKRHTMLFSATMPPLVAGLAQSILDDAVRVEVTPQATTVERIEQKVLFVDHGDKRKLLVDLLQDRNIGRAIVFTRTKHGANRVAEQLQKSGVPADAIHGNKSQGARQRALEEFRTGRLRTLVATDIAARGIDIDGVTHVINFDLPNEPESYVHRIGRTARAGADGIALSFCGADEVAYLKAIERTIRQPVPVDDGHAYHAPDIARRHTRGPGDHRPAGKPAQSKPQGKPAQGQQNRKPQQRSAAPRPSRAA
jgi:ATP-dependent RNA helicase RhlE